MKNVLVISTSLRNGSNSELLANKFADGARASGNNVEIISLKDKRISFCIGCLACQTAKQCVLKDDANEIVKKMQKADVLVFATPIYYYEMSGQMKTLIDRLNPLFVSPYNFKDVYLIAAAADSDESAIDKTIQGLLGWIECLSKTRLKDVLKATGLTNPAEAKNSVKYLKEAYTMGQNV